jgi:hypothetical protein
MVSTDRLAKYLCAQLEPLLAKNSKIHNPKNYPTYLEIFD